MGMPEMILILAVALIVIGPKKLPELAKSLGKGIVEFKKATQDFKDTVSIESEVSEFRDTVDSIKSDVRHQLTETPQSVSTTSEKNELATSSKTPDDKETTLAGSDSDSPYSKPPKSQPAENHGK